MSRLFGLSAAPQRVSAQFSPLERKSDRLGLGYFDATGAPTLHEQPLPEYVKSGVFISQPDQPYSMDGRIFAHHGALGDLSKLEPQLGSAAALLRGHSASERLFAFITQCIRAHNGHVAEGFSAAVHWIVENLPFDSLNCLLATPNELWALRYPDTHALYVLEREAGGLHGERELHYVSGTTRVRAPELAKSRSVVFASELLDDHPDWCALSVGELLHVAPDLTVSSSMLLEQTSELAPHLILPGRSAEPNTVN